MKKFVFTSTICLLTVVLYVTSIRLFNQKANAQSTDANFKVAFIGDSGASTPFQNVLNLIKAENAQMVLHQGDLDYSDGPQKWMDMVDNTLGVNFPYLASDGNHDEWDADGYAAYFKERLTKMGLTAPSGSLPPSYSVTYKGLKIVFSQEDGDPTFIDTQLKNATNTWKICSWHKNMKLMQIGGKSDEQGWPDYETCRKYGAIIATGHEHSYERTKTLTNTQTQTTDVTCPDPKNVCVGRETSTASPGKTFVFVSGLAGSSIRNQDLCLPSTPPYGCGGIWASIYTSDQGAKEGALFIIFNYNGNPNKAHGYFKNVSGQIIDEFDITATSGNNDPQVSGNPTPTVQPGSTNLSMNILLHGLGQGGDNANPSGGGNQNPTRPNRTINVTLTDINNATLPPAQGTLIFSQTSGSFQGIVPLGNNFTTGVYRPNIKVNQYLGKILPQLYTITRGQITSIPSFSLVAGDINNDNALNINDYNLVLECFSDLAPAKPTCTAAKKAAADITDDGNVNQNDYNLFLREMSVQTGG